MANIRNKFYIFSLIIFIWVSLFTADIFADDSENQDKVETIREMQENATELKKEKERLKFKWSTFKIGNESLSEILWDLNPEQLEEISDIVWNYQDDKLEQEKMLEKAIRHEHDTSEYEENLILLKRDFYTDLLPYVSEGKKDIFKKYISHDVEYNEKSKKINTEIQVIETKKKERIEEIKEKIEDNNRLLRKRIKEKVTARLEKTLMSFTSQEKFQSFSNSSKIEVFKKIQWKVSLKIKDLEKFGLSTSAIEEKIILLETIHELLDNYISNWTN